MVRCCPSGFFLCGGDLYLNINMVLPQWVYPTTKYVLLGVGFVWASEYALWIYKKYATIQRKKQSKDVANKPIAEVLFFSEECESCRNHADSNKPCSLASCPLRNLNKLIESIGTAKETVEVCIYFLTCNAIIKAITDLRKKNVSIRVITEDDTTNSDVSQLLKMRKAGIKVRCRKSQPVHLMHHKFVIVDKKLLISGSANWTMQAFYGNCENILITDHKDLIVQYMREFEELWLEFTGETNVNSANNVEEKSPQKEIQYKNGVKEPIAEVLFFSKKCASCRNHANTPCHLTLCPVKHLNKVTEYIGTATKSVDVCVFFLTCNAIVNAIIDLQRKDVLIRVITDNESCGNDASQALKMRQSGIQVRCKKSESNLLMHHKFVIVDKKILINGSANWTMQAFYGNYENILITNHSDIVEPYSVEFEKLWVKYSAEIDIQSPNNVKRRSFHNGY